MELKQSYLKRQFENVTTYQFKNNFNDVSILEVTKLKSGYQVEYKNSHTNFFKRTDGLKSMQQVKEFIKPFNY